MAKTHRSNSKHFHSLKHTLEDGNTVSAIVYLVQIAPIVGSAAAAVAFLATSSKSVRFNSLQALVLSLVFLVLAALLSASMTGTRLSTILALVAILSWLSLAYTSYKGGKLMLPLVGELSQKYSR